jgi:hypothetical protein
MVHIRLLNHCRHRLLHISFPEFIAAVFVPDGFEVEMRALQMGLEELETARVCEAGAALVVIFVGREDPGCVVFRVFVAVGFNDAFMWLGALGVGDDGAGFAAFGGRAGDVD